MKRTHDFLKIVRKILRGFRKVITGHQDELLQKTTGQLLTKITSLMRKHVIGHEDLLTWHVKTDTS